MMSDIKYDLCVVGSGPAGMMVALEFARNEPSKKVLLAEYGEKRCRERNGLDDTIVNHNPVNHHDPYECTNKCLGGSSVTWGGRCVMYDEVDFLNRPEIEGDCTWDLEMLDEMKSYLEKSADYFECGRGPFTTADMPTWRDRRIADGFVEGDVLDSPVERWSMPTRFASRYGDELERLPNITVRCGVEARGFAVPDADGVVRRMEFREVDSGKTFEVRAAAWVIAAGAQESTRLLLRNPQVFDRCEGVPDALGRYYQGHVSGKIATIQFKGDPKKTDFTFQQDDDGSYFRRRFQFPVSTIKREGILNTAIWLDNPLYHDPSHRSGAMSLMYLAMITPVLGKRLAPPAIANSITKGKVNGLPQHLWNVIRGLPGSVWSPASVFFRRYCLKRKLPGICLYSKSNRYAIHFHAEQIPDRNNRMVIGKDGESLEIFYDLTEKDISSVIRAHEVLDAWLRKCGCGELDYWFEKDKLPDAIREMSCDGIHQSGTTRMAANPELGVVDSNLRVFGTSNLYVCSSSVFPTSGQANPTFFLGAFAVRLAQHLGESA